MVCIEGGSEKLLWLSIKEINPLKNELLIFIDEDNGDRRNCMGGENNVIDDDDEESFTECGLLGTFFAKKKSFFFLCDFSDLKLNIKSSRKNDVEFDNAGFFLYPPSFENTNNQEKLSLAGPIFQYQRYIPLQPEV